jgi:DNA-binding IscR family transcriptional regulator
VIRAIDGPVVLTSCFTHHGDCDQSDTCTVREPLRKVHEGILQMLNSITIGDLSKETPDCNEAPAPPAAPQEQLYQVGARVAP